MSEVMPSFDVIGGRAKMLSKVANPTKTINIVHLNFFQVLHENNDVLFFWHFFVSLDVLQRKNSFIGTIHALRIISKWIPIANVVHSTRIYMKSPHWRKHQYCCAHRQHDFKKNANVYVTPTSFIWIAMRKDQLALCLFFTWIASLQANSK